MMENYIPLMNLLWNFKIMKSQKVKLMINTRFVCCKIVFIQDVAVSKLAELICITKI